MAELEEKMRFEVNNKYVYRLILERGTGKKVGKKIGSGEMALGMGNVSFLIRGSAFSWFRKASSITGPGNRRMGTMYAFYSEQ